MKKYFILFGVIGVVLFSFNVVNAQDVFFRNLTVGSKGSDVKLLQQFLNRFSDTQVAVSGAGSPGQETEFFGPATKSGVIKFQDKYKAEVLTPVNLTSGTGFFGPSTRAKINSIYSSTAAQVPVTSTPVVVNTAPVIVGPVVQAPVAPNNTYANTSDRSITDLIRDINRSSTTTGSGLAAVDSGEAGYGVFVDSIYPEVISTGGQVDVYGVNFGQRSRVYLDKNIVPTTFVSSTHLKFTVPDESGDDDPNDSDFLGPRIVRVTNGLSDTIMTSPQVLLVLNEEMENNSSYKNSMKNEITPINQSYKNIASEMKAADRAEARTAKLSKSFLGRAYLSLKNKISPEPAYAQGANDYYGGSITQTDVCPCLYNPGTTVSVNNKVDNQTVDLGYAIFYGSRLRANYNIFTSNVNVIGGYTQGSWSCQTTQTVYPVYTCDTGDSMDGFIDSVRGIGSASSPGN